MSNRKFNTKLRGSSMRVNSGLNDDEVTMMTDAFKLFANENGMVNPKVILGAMKELGLDETNPTVYKMVSKLDTSVAARKGGVTLEKFLDVISINWDTVNREGISKIFAIIYDGHNEHQEVDLQTLKSVANELGKDISDDELFNLILHNSGNGDLKLNVDDFYYMMSK